MRILIESLTLVGIGQVCWVKGRSLHFQAFSSAVRQFSIPSVPALRGDEAQNHTVCLLFCFRAALSNLEQGLLYNCLEFCPLPPCPP